MFCLLCCCFYVWFAQALDENKRPKLMVCRLIVNGSGVILITMVISRRRASTVENLLYTHALLEDYHYTALLTSQTGQLTIM